MRARATARGAPRCATWTKVFGGDPTFTLAMLCALVAVSEWLVRHTALRHLGAALLVILLGVVAANAGLVPTGATSGPARSVYRGVFAYVAPAAIFWLLLSVDLRPRQIARAGLPMIGVFLLGSLGTTLGVLAGMAAIDGPATIGPLHSAVGGMYAGTYTGGSINFNAIALHYGVQEQGVIYVGAIAVDNILTAVWMAIGLVLPRLMGGAQAGSELSRVEDAERSPGEADEFGEDAEERVRVYDLAVMLAIGLLSVYAADQLASLWGLPSILVLTIIALLLAQLSWVRGLVGARVLGLFAVQLFLVVIGVYCDFAAFVQLGELGPALALFAVITVAVHGLVTYGGAWLLGVDVVVASVASQANIGGGTSAMALARSLGRGQLVLPAIIIGALGTALGTFIGFFVAERLL